MTRSRFYRDQYLYSEPAQIAKILRQKFQIAEVAVKSHSGGACRSN